jgi:hypothetical protein
LHSNGETRGRPGRNQFLGWIIAKGAAAVVTYRRLAAASASPARIEAFEQGRS